MLHNNVQVKNSSKSHHNDHDHLRSNALRASSPALRTDVLVIVPVAVASLPFPPTATLPAAFALFAAAATRKRLAPLGRFNRVIVALPPLLTRDTISTSIPIATPTPPPRSRSKRRRNGLGRFSSSCKSYFGVAGGAHDVVSSGVTVPEVPEDDDADDDDDDDTDDEEENEGGTALVVIASRSGVSVAVASTRFAWDREETDGRRRRLGRRAGGAGAVREGTGAVVAWDCAFVDALRDLYFEGDLCTELARVDIRPGAEPSVFVWVLVVSASGLRFEGDLLVGVDPVIRTSAWKLILSSSSALSKSNIFAKPRLLLPILGVSTKISTSLLLGIGVASGSPVSVSMTPFMADARGNAGGPM